MSPLMRQIQGFVYLTQPRPPAHAAWFGTTNPVARSLGEILIEEASRDVFVRLFLGFGVQLLGLRSRSTVVLQW